MRESQKNQIRLIVALSLVLMAFAAAIVTETLLRRGQSVPAASTTTETGAIPDADETPSKPHTLYRSARLNLGAAADLEINLGGSGDETAVNALPYGDKLYIFANSSSSDFDCEGRNGRAVCFTLSRELAVLSRAYIGGEGERLESAIYGEGGFLCAFSSDGKVTLRLIGFDGGERAKVPAGTAGPCEFAGLKLLHSGYALIVSAADSLIEKRRLLFQCFDFALEKKYERTVSDVYSLSYIDCFESGEEITLFFNASADIGCYAGAAVLRGDNISPSVTIIKDAHYRAEAAMPYTGGWAMAVIFKEGGGGLMLLTGAFAKTKTLYSAVNNTARAHLFFAGGAYYTAFYGDERQVTAYDESLSVSSEVEGLTALNSLDGCLTIRGSAVFFGRADRPVVLSTAAGKTIVLGATGDVIKAVVTLNGELYAVCESRTTCADVGGNFGGSDLWLARLKV